MLSLAAIAYVSITDRSRVGEVVDYGLVFPELIDQLNDVAVIRIDTFNSAFQLKRSDNEWQVSAYQDYPTRSDAVSKFLLGLAQLRKVEPKTSDPDNFSLLHLIGIDHEESPTIRVRLEAANNRTMASLLIGKRQQSARNFLLNELFVREPSENQTWLAESGITVPTQAIEWLDTEIIDFDEQVDQVLVASPGHLPFRIARNANDIGKFDLVNLPENHKIRHQFRLNDIGEFFRRLKFTDVKRISDEVAGISVTAQTKDNLEITATLGEGALKNFAKFVATTTDSAPPIAISEAQALNRKWSGWMYRISDVRRQTAELTLADLVEPLNGVNSQSN